MQRRARCESQLLRLELVCIKQANTCIPWVFAAGSREKLRALSARAHGGAARAGLAKSPRGCNLVKPRS